VLMRLPVRVSGRGRGAWSFQEETYTLAIARMSFDFDRGASDVRGRGSGSRVEHARKGDAGVCVAHVVQDSRRGNRGGVEFMLPNETVLARGVPPKDGTPRHSRREARGWGLVGVVVTCNRRQHMRDLFAKVLQGGSDQTSPKFPGRSCSYRILLRLRPLDELPYLLYQPAPEDRSVTLTRCDSTVLPSILIAKKCTFQ